MAKHIKLIMVLSVLIYINTSYLYAQEKVAAREEGIQRYQQGKTLYSQGRYEEAAIEFDKAITLVTPAEMKFQEKIQKDQGRALGPGASQETTTSFSTPITLVTPTEMQFEQGIQKGQEKVLAPALPKEVTLPKKKIAAKKKEEKKETGAVGTITAEGAAPETGEREYYIDVGDVLDISVWQIPDLSKSEVIVRPDGKISFPLIGDIKAEGLSLTLLNNIITERLKTYVKAPQVSIMIRRFGEQANKVIVLGEVMGPGVYKFSGPPTITELIASAGGYTKYAVLNSIMVIRGDLRTKPEVIRVNFAQIIKNGRLSENVSLKPNDIVYLPKSFIGNINTFLEIFQPAISEYMQTLNVRYLHNVVHRNK